MGGMMTTGPQRPEYGRGQGCGLMAALLLGLLLCLLLGSCRSQGQALMSSSASADSAWLRVLGERTGRDSTVYRERVEIVPRIVRAGDTTIVRMDTSIYRLTERTVYNQYNVYSDSGRARRDSLAVTYRLAGGSKTTAGGQDNLWKHLAVWLVIVVVYWLIAWIVFGGGGNAVRRLLSWKRKS